MPKVSFLVPVYNVSAYIGRCARSLFEQTFDDIEYIFVNDCTPDDSMERLEAVIEQYPERAGQVKIINQEQNQGPGTARNVALLAASGEYVCCVDSDDYVDADMVDAMYAKAVAEGADIVVADMWMEYPEMPVTIYTDNVSPNVLACDPRVFAGEPQLLRGPLRDDLPVFPSQQDSQGGRGFLPLHAFQRQFHNPQGHVEAF